jgi:hypothetical protein
MVETPGTSSVIRVRTGERRARANARRQAGPQTEADAASEARGAWIWEIIPHIQYNSRTFHVIRWRCQRLAEPFY